MKSNVFMTWLKPMIVLAGMLLWVSAIPTGATAQEPPVEEQEKKVFPFEDEVLLAFFDVNQEVSALQRETQEKINETVAAHGLTMERFNQIARASQIGALGVGAFSNEEIEQFNQVAPKITAIQREMQSMTQGLIAEKGISPQQYQDIINALRTDADLQAHLRDLARERAMEAAREERRRQREAEANENNQTPPQ